MYLKAIHLNGFKSFPDKTVIDFEKGLTVIVGPNGSGKSNISDAVRWVLGEQSVKNLRSEKMEDVIFNGTENQRKAAGMAYVSLILDNTEGVLPNDHNEIMITRRLYRSGESEYLINNQIVRLRDVYELFMDTGIGRDGYSIIGQGKIAEILSTKSEERRQVFEEAAGISKFRYRKVEAQRKLTGAEENLIRLNDILQELEGRVEPLRIESERAQRYLVLRDERRILEINLWLRDIEKLSESFDKIRADYNTAKSQLEMVTMSLDEGEKSLDQYFEQSQASDSIVEEHREEMHQQEETLNTLLSENAVNDSVCKQNELLLAQIESDKQVQITKIEMLTENAQGDAERVDILNKKMQALELELSELLKQAEEQNQQYSAINSKFDSDKQTLAQKRNDITMLNMELENKQNIVISLREKTLQSGTKIEEKTRELTSKQSELKSREGEISALKEESSTSDNILYAYEMKISAKESRLNKQKNEAETLRTEVVNLTQRASTLSDMQKHYEGFNNSVRSIMRAHERGQLRGILGPVSQLVSTKTEYVTAIETALGQASQNVVVDNEDCAKICINFLKNENAGRATFLPIENIKGNLLSRSEIKKDIGVIAIASSLVQYDAKITGVVDSLLGRTVIAENIDYAVAIAKANSYKFRIVTLDGQIINAGGAMTGGSQVKTTGFISRENEILELIAKKDELSKQLHEMNTNISLEADAISALKVEYNLEKDNIIKNEKSLFQLENEITHLTFMISSIQNDMAEIEAQTGKENDSIKQNEDAVKALITRIEQRTEQILILEQTVNQAEQDVQITVSQVEAMRESVNNKRIEVLDAKGQMERAIEQVRGYDKQRTDIEEQITILTQRADVVETDNNQRKEKITQNNAQCDILQNSVNDLKKEIEQILGRRDNAEKDVTEIRATLRSLSVDKENLVREVTRMENKISSGQAEYDSLIAKLWDEYQLTMTVALEARTEIENIAQSQKRLNQIRNEMKQLGDVFIGAIEEYKEVSERYEFLKIQIADIESAKTSLNKIIEELTRQMKDIFATQFESINENFDACFKELFGGGHARLSFADPTDILNSGIEIEVQPPGKIVKSITALSGGEQAFVAIALYFAMLKIRPTPFCVLDEIEAALDETNVARFATYIKKYCRNTQFVIITHRRGTMDVADILYGVTMQEKGVSKMLTINVNEAIKHISSNVK